MRYGEFTMIETDTQRKTNFAVTLTPCNLKENTYIARVPRKTITTDQLLDLVSAHNQGIDRFSVAHAMELLKKRFLSKPNSVFQWILWTSASSILLQRPVCNRLRQKPKQLLVLKRVLL